MSTSTRSELGYDNANTSSGRALKGTSTVVARENYRRHISTQGIRDNLAVSDDRVLCGSGANKGYAQYLRKQAQKNEYQQPGPVR